MAEENINKENDSSSKSELSDLLSDFDTLTRDEQWAFLAFFATRKATIVKYGESNDVSFGKSECECVDFDDFWLNKLPGLGFVCVEEVKRYIAKGMICEPEAVEYRILVTKKGYMIRDALKKRLNG